MSRRIIKFWKEDKLVDAIETPEIDEEGRGDDTFYLAGMKYAISNLVDGFTKRRHFNETGSYSLAKYNHEHLEALIPYFKEITGIRIEVLRHFITGTNIHLPPSRGRVVPKLKHKRKQRWA